MQKKAYKNHTREMAKLMQSADGRELHQFNRSIMADASPTKVGKRTDVRQQAKRKSLAIQQMFDEDSIEQSIE